MRSPSKQQYQNIFTVSVRRVPLNWLLLCIVSVALFLTVLTSTPPPLRQQQPTFKYHRYFSSPSFQDPVELYRSFRRLRQKTLSDWLDITLISAARDRSKEVEICGEDKENFVPCYNVSANLLSGFHSGDEFDRHCGLHRDPSTQPTVTRCSVRPPRGYKIPLQWPEGKDIIWKSNVNISKDHFSASSSFTKRLMLVEDNQIAFNSEEGGDSEDVKDYSNQIAEMMGLGSESELLQSGVRTVLDIGCGFGSFGAHLISLGLMTTCVASYEEFDSTVQVALERGLPALIGTFNSRQLPYPALSFDFIHCAQCDISWGQKDGAFLIEVDRMLRPGGYFGLTSPIRNLPGVKIEEKVHLRKKNRVLFANIERFAEEICWNVLGKLDETIVLQKTSDITCYSARKEYSIPICKEEGSKEHTYYYESLKTCITADAADRWIPIQNKSHWFVNSDYLNSGRLSVLHGIEHEDFIEDSRVWEVSLNKFWSLLTPLIFSDHPKRPTDGDPMPPLNMIRNVMDMNADYGGLNAAFLKGRNSVWVMNVVSTANENANTHLPLILDRGFTGLLHDWCEPFPTYPRTYDMLHAMGLFSSLISTDKCNILDLFLEMDRILRPEGWVVLRDKTSVIENARAFAAQIHWETRIIDVQSDNNERLLICQKPFFHK